MLQVSLKNRKEYKVICFNGEVQYIANINRLNIGKVFSQPPHTELFNFVKDAIKHLHRLNVGAIVNCVVRVDVVKNAKGELKVNEFESLEANRSHKNFYVWTEMDNKLCKFWYKTLSVLLKN